MVSRGNRFSLDESAYFFQGAYRTEVWARFPAQRLSPLESWNPYSKEVAGPTAAREASHRSKHRLFCLGRRFGCYGAGDGAPATAKLGPDQDPKLPIRRRRSIKQQPCGFFVELCGTMRNPVEPGRGPTALCQAGISEQTVGELWVAGVGGGLHHGAQVRARYLGTRRFNADSRAHPARQSCSSLQTNCDTHVTAAFWHWSHAPFILPLMTPRRFTLCTPSPHPACRGA